MTYQEGEGEGVFVELEPEPLPEDVLPGEAVPPEGDGEVVLPEGDGEVVLPEGDSAGEVVPAGESLGEEPPAGVSPLFGWQADSAVIKPSRSITITFDLTVKILTFFKFRLLSYPSYRKGGFHATPTSKGKDFLAYFLLLRSNEQYLFVNCPRF
jgi:hypothetical protein